MSFKPNEFLTLVMKGKIEYMMTKQLGETVFVIQSLPFYKFLPKWLNFWANRERDFISS